MLIVRPWQTEEAFELPDSVSWKATCKHCSRSLHKLFESLTCPHILIAHADYMFIFVFVFRRRAQI